MIRNEFICFVWWRSYQPKNKKRRNHALRAMMQFFGWYSITKHSLIPLWQCHTLLGVSMQQTCTCIIMQRLSLTTVCPLYKGRTTSFTGQCLESLGNSTYTVVGHNLVPKILFYYIFYTKQNFFNNPLFLW
jgi:hypothetical protein